MSGTALRFPDFLVIGAMKCATSTLHEQLGRQPGIFVSDPKEPGYFSHDAVYARGPEWYAALFEDAGPSDLCGESSTHYTKLPTHPKCAERIRRDLGEVKLVYVMRDPVERLVSHYVHAWSMREIRMPFERALDAHPELVDYGRYAMQLEPYLAAFGRDAVLPVFQERLQAAPQAELERVCRFLGYTATPTWDPEYARRNASDERLRQSAWRDALVAAPVLRTLRRRLVPQALRDRVKDWWRIRERPELAPERRAEVEARFAEDLDRLGRWLGIELRCGAFAESVAAAAPEWSTECP